MNDREFDIIIVGAGTAGMAAAVAAADRGLKVALVEASDKIGGTLNLSNASISAGGTSIQARNGIEDSAELHFDDCLRLNEGTGDRDLIRLWTYNAADTIEWLCSIGWSCSPDRPLFAYEHNLYSLPRTYRSKNLGLGVIDVFRPLIERAQKIGNIKFFLNTRVLSLMNDGQNINGVQAQKDLVDIEMKSRAVIITAGGYAGSEKHWRDLHHIVPPRFFYNTILGDGLDMIVNAGGYVRYSERFRVAFGGTRSLESPNSIWIRTAVLPHFRPPWEIYVNSCGQRFMAEDEPSIDARELVVLAQPNQYFWCIYDQYISDNSPKLFLMDDDQVRQLFAEGGDYVVADSIEELSTKCATNLETLRKTIDDYNFGQAAGSDLMGRRHLPAPIVKGPFYAVKHYGVAISTAAGIAVNSDLAPVRTDGTAIGGLFAAGDVLGAGFLGKNFLSGSLVSSALTFGRHLGQNVLA